MVNLVNFIVFLLLFILPRSNSITFNFPNFQASNTQNISFEGNASPNGELQVTINQLNTRINSSVGRASYLNPIPLWDSKTNNLTDFTTHFTFKIEPVNKTDQNIYGDGLAFFLAPFDSKLPPNSSGGHLGLVSVKNRFNTSMNQIVAVEFDTYPNADWDPTCNHVGIDINSIKSVANVCTDGLTDTGTADAWIHYNSTTYNLSVSLLYDNNPVAGRNVTVSYIVDLRTVLPETIRVGFSAATGSCYEIHSVASWEFSSTLIISNITLSEPPSPIVSLPPSPTVSPPKGDMNTRNKNGSLVIVGIVLPIICVLCSIFGLFLFLGRKRRMKMGGDDLVEDVSIDDEFEKGTGPKRFTFAELSRATENFSEEGKLGQGGFGCVYKGMLMLSNIEIAVKRISEGSKQGKKEYISEVTIISRMRHRNLVQLIGWCHEKRELLLVYEYMPNGSLDSHLFGNKVTLTWVLRYKVALGLASALLYLHEEWEQCVVHRDVKSSNVMLDSEFNAKLGDFGLARFVGHGQGSQTTILAGTMGYLAPECFSTGKSSKESDVYSFGVVALEMACGRKAIETWVEPSKVRLVEFVWDLYGKDKLLEAVDLGLNMEYDEAQMKCLMVVGLWCCHPDFARRPTIRQVINVLNFESPFPNLPSKLPVPMYFEPPMDVSSLMYTSSSGFVTDSEKYQMTQSSSSTTESSMSESPFMASFHSSTK